MKINMKVATRLYTTIIYIRLLYRQCFHVDGFRSY